MVPNLPWELIYFVDVAQIDIPKEKLIVSLGYSASYVVPGINRVDDARLERALESYGSIAELVGSLED